MNERIRELAVQARQYAWENETHWSAGPERERLFEQKFAELIVQECLSVIEEMNPHDPERDIDDIFDEVDKHFGVAE